MVARAMPTALAVRARCSSFMSFAVHDRCMTPPCVHAMTACSDSHHHQAPARPSLGGCRGHWLMSIKGPFLLTSLAFSLCLTIRLVAYVLMFWGESAAGLLPLVMTAAVRAPSCPSLARLCRDRASPRPLSRA